MKATIRSRTTLAHALFLSGALAAASAAQERAATQIEPDPEIQAAIEAATNVTDQTGLDAALERLRAVGGEDFQLLIPQLVLFSARARDTKDGMAMGVLIDELRIRDDAVVRALVPLLETREPALQKRLARILSQYEKHTADRPPSFAVYQPFLAEAIRAGKEPPAGLVRHLYRTDAGTAFLLLLRLYRTDRSELRALLWAEHVIEDTLWKQRFGFLERDRVEPAAADELDMLSLHPRWWARLYAAQILADVPAFRTPALVERLAGDRDALVRETAGPLLEKSPGKGRNH